MERTSGTDAVSNSKLCFMLRCTHRPVCKAQHSVFNSSMFFRAKLPISDIVQFFHLWLCKTDRVAVSGILGWSEKTVIKMQMMMWEIVSGHSYTEISVGEDDEYPEDHTMIGGPGIEVQIDESAFGQRKYNCGHFVATKWVMGGIEILADRHGRKCGGKIFSLLFLTGLWPRSMR